MEQATITSLHQQIVHGATVCIDSRKAVDGDIFFALRGDSFDGNDFIPQAFENGCHRAVTDNPKAVSNAQCILVDDVLKTLQLVGQFHRNTLDIPVIGITGSNGKTTTKELCHAVLSAAFNAKATKGNLNNHIGVPLTLLSLIPPPDIAIVEMGANHLNEIAHLCELANPGFGLITNIGKAHLEGFGSFENVIRAKTELYRYIEKQKGVLFINGDDDILLTNSPDSPVVYYGTNRKCHLTGTITETHPTLSLSYQVNQQFGKASTAMSGQINTQLSGVYNFYNVMAAVTIGLYFGVPSEKVKTAIEDYIPRNARSQIHKTKKNTIILDAYNANPTSMTASITHFAYYKKLGKTVAILGDMLELGKYAHKEHVEIGQLALSHDFDHYIFVGKHFSAAIAPTNRVKVFQLIAEAKEWLTANPLSQAYILLKGSRGIMMECLMDQL